jgi:hypothetical protein
MAKSQRFGKAPMVTPDRELDAVARVYGNAERFRDYQFAVGDEVRWWLIPMDDRKYGYLGDAYSMDVRRGITHWLQVASWGEEPRRKATRARVTSIEAMYIDYEMRPDENADFPLPVPGSAIYEDRQQSTGWLTCGGRAKRERARATRRSRQCLVRSQPL